MSTPNTKYGPIRIAKMLSSCRSVYFIGIGGISMSSLALMTQRMGWRVGGSDRTETDLTDWLTKEGICINYQHAADQVEPYDAVVYTVAISPDNPEYVAAQQSGKPLISRADYLGYLMTHYRQRVGVSGMHGKSTCTGMLAQIFMDAQKQPTVLCGAETPRMGGAFTIGDEDLMVFEACEYMDSFLHFNPNVVVILNVEPDHLDYFSGLDQIIRSFSAFAAKTGENGYVVANGEDPNVAKALQSYRGHICSFSMRPETGDYYPSNIRFEKGNASFDIFKKGEFFGHVSLRIPGKHSIMNALAATAAADLCGVSPKSVCEALSCFCGISRRMEWKGLFHGADVYDDYAHHPTEIRATLSGIRSMGFRRVFCVFQSHTYTRTAKLLDEFAGAFEDADRVIFAEIYAAREKDTQGMSPSLLAQKVGKKASYEGGMEQIVDKLAEELDTGDVLVVMGAGDIYKIYPLMGLSTEKKDS